VANEENRSRFHWRRFASRIHHGPLHFTVKPERFITQRATKEDSMTHKTTILPALIILLTNTAAYSFDVITKSNSMTGFFDASSGTRTFEFASDDFSSSPFIKDVNLSVTFAKSDNNSFVAEDEALGTGTPFLDEIQLRLTSPSGTTITLIEFGTFDSGADGFRGSVTFDESAAHAVDSDPFQLMSGTFRPVGDASGGLERLNGESAVGEWALSVADSAGGDGLSFYRASLQVQTVPEPAAIWLILATGAVGLFVRRRISGQPSGQIGF